MSNLFKTGMASIVIGPYHYNGYFGHRNGKILKISRRTRHHDERQHLNKIRQIRNYSRGVIYGPNLPVRQYSRVSVLNCSRL